jgi:hypothetical protein
MEMPGQKGRLGRVEIGSPTVSQPFLRHFLPKTLVFGQTLEQVKKPFKINSGYVYQCAEFSARLWSSSIWGSHTGVSAHLLYGFKPFKALGYIW